MPNSFSDLADKINYAALLQNCIRVVLVLFFAIVIWMVIRMLINRMQNRMIKRAEIKSGGIHGAQERAETVGTLMRRVIGTLFWVMVLMTLLSQIGVKIGALIAGAGIFGLAIGFGSQQIVKNYISGFFMVLENQISVGDIAIINGTWGTVESINFRTTILRSMDSTVHVFSNGDVTQLSNATKGWGAYVFKVGVGYNEDADRVMEIIRRVGAEMREDEELGPSILDDMELHGVNELTESGFVIRGRFRTTPINQWAVGRAFLARVKAAFQKEGVELPFPHRTLYFGKEGAPFLHGDAPSDAP